MYFEAPDAVVLFDPLVPTEDPARFHEALDRDVERAGKPVRVLLTTAHTRAARASWPSATAARSVSFPEASRSAPRRSGSSSSGFRATALVTGDVILGRDGGLRLPRTWLGEAALGRGDRAAEPAARAAGRAGAGHARRAGPLRRARRARAGAGGAEASDLHRPSGRSTATADDARPRPRAAKPTRHERRRPPAARRRAA